MKKEKEEKKKFNSMGKSHRIRKKLSSKTKVKP